MLFRLWTSFEVLEARFERFSIFVDTPRSLDLVDVMNACSGYVPGLPPDVASCFSSFAVSVF